MLDRAQKRPWPRAAFSLPCTLVMPALRSLQGKEGGGRERKSQSSRALRSLWRGVGTRRAGVISPPGAGNRA